MIHLKKFNESNSSDVEDYIFSYFEQDPSFTDINENWIYCEYYDYSNAISTDKLDGANRHFSGVRFKGWKYMIDYDTESGTVFLIIIKNDFYKSNFKVSDIIWGDHELKNTRSDFSGSFNDAMRATNLPKDVSLISGSIFNGKEIYYGNEDPFRIESDVELQYHLYKATS